MIRCLFVCLLFLPLQWPVVLGQDVTWEIKNRFEGSDESDQSLHISIMRSQAGGASSFSYSVKGKGEDTAIKNGEQSDDVTLEDGVVGLVFNVELKDDLLSEDDEVVVVTVKAENGRVLAAKTIIIRDNDRDSSNATSSTTTTTTTTSSSPTPTTTTTSTITTTRKPLVYEGDTYAVVTAFNDISESEGRLTVYLTRSPGMRTGTVTFSMRGGGGVNSAVEDVSREISFGAVYIIPIDVSDDDIQEEDEPLTISIIENGEVKATKIIIVRDDDNPATTQQGSSTTLSSILTSSSTRGTDGISTTTTTTTTTTQMSTSTSLATSTVTNPSPTFKITQLQANESNSKLFIQIQKTPTDGEVTFTYTVKGKGGADTVIKGKEVSGDHTLGERSAILFLNIPLQDDDIVEEDEEITVTITIDGKPVATEALTVKDDDGTTSSSSSTPSSTSTSTSTSTTTTTMPTSSSTTSYSTVFTSSSTMSTTTAEATFKITQLQASESNSKLFIQIQKKPTDGEVTFTYTVKGKGGADTVIKGKEVSGDHTLGERSAILFLNIPLQDDDIAEEDEEITVTITIDGKPVATEALTVKDDDGTTSSSSSTPSSTSTSTSTSTTTTTMPTSSSTTSYSTVFTSSSTMSTTTAEATFKITQLQASESNSKLFIQIQKTPTDGEVTFTYTVKGKGGADTVIKGKEVSGDHTLGERSAILFLNIPLQDDDIAEEDEEITVTITIDGKTVATETLTVKDDDGTTSSSSSTPSSTSTSTSTSTTPTTQSTTTTSTTTTTPSTTTTSTTTTTMPTSSSTTSYSTVFTSSSTMSTTTAEATFKITQLQASESNSKLFIQIQKTPTDGEVTFTYTVKGKGGADTVIKGKEVSGDHTLGERSAILFLNIPLQDDDIVEEDEEITVTITIDGKTVATETLTVKDDDGTTSSSSSTPSSTSTSTSTSTTTTTPSTTTTSTTTTTPSTTTTSTTTTTMPTSSSTTSYSTVFTSSSSMSTTTSEEEFIIYPPTGLTESNKVITINYEFKGKGPKTFTIKVKGSKSGNPFSAVDDKTDTFHIIGSGSGPWKNDIKIQLIDDTEKEADDGFHITVTDEDGKEWQKIFVPIKDND